jgi:glycosyltransferase involved in cell wall biosynthesis
MKKILIIPHSANTQVRIRLLEISRALSRRYEIFYLNWHEPDVYSLSGRIKAAFLNAFTTFKFSSFNNMQVVNIPIFHRPFSLAHGFNRSQILRLMRYHHIEVLIHGLNYFFPAPLKPASGENGYLNIFDFNDLPTEAVNSFREKIMNSFTQAEALKADYITACSLGLVKYVWDAFGKKAVYIPNGADFKEFNLISDFKVNEIRHKYSSEDKFVIGYIGNTGEWVDMNLLVKAYRIFKLNFPRCALWIVGGGVCLDQYRKEFSGEDIVFTGAIPKDQISAYFAAIDIGVNPSKKSIFQDKAFHIKLVEYAAARKIAISTPLEELEYSQFPHVLIREPSVECWAKAFMQARDMGWDKRWDSLSEIYDWNILGEEFSRLIER